MHLSRRQFIAATSAAAVALTLPAKGQPVAAPARKNVLFIAVDDLRPMLGCYGNTLVKTPSIDKFAATGTVFLFNYCQQAVSAPSRASLLSGCRPDTTRVWDLQTPLSTTRPELVTLPQCFKNAGYTTVSLGKIYHHPEKDDPKGWSGDPVRFPGMLWLTPENNKIIDELKAKSQTQRDARGPAWECADVSDTAYSDGKIAQAAIGQLQDFAKSGKPFFLAVGFLRPHLPFCAPKRYWDLYDPAAIPLADNPQPPKNAPKIALHTSGEIRAYHGIPKQGDVATKEVARKLIHGYLASTSYADAQIGKVLDALQSAGLAENTVVVLWGDHGWHLGDHGLWCKHTNFETATHAPLIIRAPGTSGIAPGKTQRLSEFVDVYPTLCELANVEPPTGLEGVSLMPLMKNPDLPAERWKKGAFSQYPRGGGVMGYSVTDGTCRFTSWKNKDGSVTAAELYDHRVDPEENNNLADDPAAAELRKKMATLLEQGWKAANSR